MGAGHGVHPALLPHRITHYGCRPCMAPSAPLWRMPFPTLLRTHSHALLSSDFVFFSWCLPTPPPFLSICTWCQGLRPGHLPQLLMWAWHRSAPGGWLGKSGWTNRHSWCLCGHNPQQEALGSGPALHAMDVSRVSTWLGIFGRNTGTSMPKHSVVLGVFERWRGS